MFVNKALDILGVGLLTLACASVAVAQTAPYPQSSVITEITFDMTTLKELADGSDNWVITWADDGHQYISWGDGGGFGASGSGGDDRVSFGVQNITRGTSQRAKLVRVNESRRSTALQVAACDSCRLSAGGTLQACGPVTAAVRFRGSS